MKSFFDLENIAVVGASSNKQKLGHQLLKNLRDAGFKGGIFPVNLKEEKILSLKTFVSVLDIPEKIDLAVVIIPREAVLAVVKECVQKEISYVLIITAGFAEKDDFGRKLQKEITEAVAQTQTRIIGPNCLGLINSAKKINLTFAASYVKNGQISLILQSGAIGAAIYDWAKGKNIGINKFVSLGNKADITENEALTFLAEDDQTKAIFCYLEEISNPQEFLKITREVGEKKPIVILKGGLTAQGVRAASSHTAALSSPSEFDLGIFAEANLIVAENFEEMLNLIIFFSGSSSGLSKNTLAIVTNAGGPGILAADAASKFDLKVPKISEEEQEKLSRDLTDFASLANPIDLGGDAPAERYRKIIDLIINSPAFGAILAILTPQTMTEVEETAEVLTRFKNNFKPVVAVMMGGEKLKPAKEKFFTEHLPCFEDPAEAVALLGKVAKYFAKKKEVGKELEFRNLKNFRNLEPEKLISQYDLPMVKSFLITNTAELSTAQRNIDFPLVYKSASEAHRGKAGKVKLNINDNNTLKKAVRTIGLPGILQKMAESEYEVFLGAKNDPKYGLFLIFGSGGILVEEEKDLLFRAWPLTAYDLDEMIEGAQIWQTIKDFSVKPLLKETILKVARLMSENQDIKALELNPIKIFKEKIIAVDINFERQND